MNLRTEGIASVPGLSHREADELAAHLVASPCYPGHVRVYGDGQPRYHGAEELGAVFCHAMEDVLAAPHFWELALRTMPAAREYLEAPDARLYSVNAFWARPWGGEPVHDLQTWHRDHDDERFVAMFVYGTDVLWPAAGPHCFLAGTHAGGAGSGDSIKVYGPAGSAFMADTSGVHMGERPGEGCRLLLWARWGVSPRPRSYDIDRLDPVPAAVLGDRLPDDAATRAAVALVVA